MLEAEDRELLKQTAELARENNRMLHNMINTQRWTLFWSFVKWIIVVGSAIGAYYYLQPYLETLINAYQGVMKSLPL